jgi:hypothetical protein
MAMPLRRFSCGFAFTDTHLATRNEIDELLLKMIDSLVASGVQDMVFSGDVEAGTLKLTFSAPTESMSALGLVIKALNAGRVRIGGWPSDQVIDRVIAEVDLLEFATLR